MSNICSLLGAPTGFSTFFNDTVAVASQGSMWLYTDHSSDHGQLLFLWLYLLMLCCHVRLFWEKSSYRWKALFWLNSSREVESIRAGRDGSRNMKPAWQSGSKESTFYSHTVSIAMKLAAKPSYKLQSTPTPVCSSSSKAPSPKESSPPPNNTTNWRSSIQTHKPMGDISH